MKITDVNTPNQLKDYIEKLKKEFANLFNKVNNNGELYIICDFPAVTDYFGKVSLFILINIPFEKGSYYRFNYNDKWCYLNSLAICINFVPDNSICKIDDINYYNENGEYQYTDELEKQSSKYSQWGYSILESYFKCFFFDWVKSSSTDEKIQNDYVILNKPIDWRNIIISAYKRDLQLKNEDNNKLSCFYLSENSFSLDKLASELIEKANEQTAVGILTKKKIDNITKSVKNTEKIQSSQGEKLCLVTGKAGSGKTLALMRALYGIVLQNEHVRFLTYNNLLAIDIKQYIRNIGGINSKNAAIETLHKFFYKLSKRMHVSSLLENDRIQEILDVLNERIKIAEDILYAYKESYGELPYFGTGESKDIDKENKFIEKVIKSNNIESSDKYEVENYIRYILGHSDINLEENKKNYIEFTKSELQKELGHNVFINDYNKVLETMYLMLDNTKEFVEKFNIKNRRVFLSMIKESENKGDIKDDEDMMENLDNFIKKSSRASKWSRSIIIDEGQDCNIYEKLIIMKLRGSENLIVASGGKDQLIRKSQEIDWRVAAGTPIPYEEIKLGRKCYRLKGNIVRFVNEFNSYYSLTDPINVIEELNNKGNVIIDFRKTVPNYVPINMIENLMSQSKVMGCSPYEGLMLLVPSSGFTDKLMDKKIVIDDDDNVKQIDVSSQRKLLISNIPNVNIWNGTIETKSKLNLPRQDQVRCIHYESCRGLESWSVVCLNLDVFFKTKYMSNDAEQYSVEQANMFMDKEVLKRNYALLWCNMVFTRAIDTLYIKISDTNCEFSKNLIDIARNCGDSVQILM